MPYISATAEIMYAPLDLRLVTEFPGGHSQPLRKLLYNKRKTVVLSLETSLGAVRKTLNHEGHKGITKDCFFPSFVPPSCPWWFSGGSEPTPPPAAFPLPGSSLAA